MDYISNLFAVSDATTLIFGAMFTLGPELD